MKEKKEDKTRKESFGRNNVILIGIIALVIIVLFAFFFLQNKGAPQQPSPSPGVEISVQNLLTEIVKATERVENFKYDITAELQSAGNTSQKVIISGSGEVDLNNRKMHTNLYITTPDGLQSSEVYMIQDTTYVNISNHWVKRTAEGAWDFEDTNIMRLRDMLDSSNGSVIGTETVNGEEARVIKITPKIEELIKYVTNLQGASLSQEQTTNITTLFDQYVKTVELTLWVDSQNLILKAKLDADIDMSTYPPVNARILIDASLNLLDYNKGAIIELPDAAADAVDLSSITA